MRFSYRRLATSSPVYSLGGVAWRDYPICLASISSGSQVAACDTLMDSGADDIILPVTVAQGLGIDLTNAPVSQARSVSRHVVTYHYAQVTLRLSDGREHCAWNAIVGFVPQRLRWGNLGRAGFFQYFDVAFLTDAREVVVLPNATFPGQYLTP